MDTVPIRDIAAGVEVVSSVALVFPAGPTVVVAEIEAAVGGVEIGVCLRSANARCSQQKHEPKEIQILFHSGII